MTRLTALIIAAVIPLCLSCSGKPVTVTDTFKPGKIAVLPVISRKSDMDLYRINEYFYAAVKRELPGKSVMDKDTVYGEYEKLGSAGDISAYRENSLKTAQSVNADSYLTGYLSYFRERKGSELGVEEPASVIFTMQLVDVKSNSTVWTYRFDETQLPLLSDVTKLSKFFKRKGKWITAEELLREGIDMGASRLSAMTGAGN